VKKTPITKTTYKEALRREHGMSSEEADEILKTVFDVMRKGIMENRDVRINTVGILKPRPSKPRQGINPRTLEPVNIPASTYVGFTISEPLKKELKKRDTTEDEE
jgi:nucleoid DNA-binding protein